MADVPRHLDVWLSLEVDHRFFLTTVLFHSTASDSLASFTIFFLSSPFDVVLSINHQDIRLVNLDLVVVRVGRIQLVIVLFSAAFLFNDPKLEAFAWLSTNRVFLVLLSVSVSFVMVVDVAGAAGEGKRTVAFFHDVDVAQLGDQAHVEVLLTVVVR